MEVLANLQVKINLILSHVVGSEALYRFLFWFSGVWMRFSIIWLRRECERNLSVNKRIFVP